ncbi:hypothetical protein ACU8KH_00494 [Lachancea thermotolerans]
MSRLVDRVCWLGLRCRVKGPPIIWFWVAVANEPSHTARVSGGIAARAQQQSVKGMPGLLGSSWKRLQEALILPACQPTAKLAFTSSSSRYGANLFLQCAVQILKAGATFSHSHLLAFSLSLRPLI